MYVIFFLLANISITNKGLPVVFCKGFSCVLRMTYIITRQIRSPIHSVSFSHRAHVCKTRGEVILSRRTFLSLTELTDLTELFHQRFEPTEGLRHTDITEASPPAPLRMERGVVCEVTPIRLLIKGDGLLGIQRTYRGISVITPLSIRRGAGGEASLGCKVL